MLRVYFSGAWMPRNSIWLSASTVVTVFSTMSVSFGWPMSSSSIVSKTRPKSNWRAVKYRVVPSWMPLGPS